MKILFIGPTRLGDGVLSTGALAYFIDRYPGAQITVCCGPLVTGLFEATPGIARILPIKKEKYNLHWIKLAPHILFETWDVVIDLRNSLLTRLLWAREKYIWGRQDKTKHKVEQIAQVIAATPPPAPRLWFNASHQAAAEKLVPSSDTPIIGVGPAANWLAKTWPAENFIALLHQLTAETGILPQAKIAVFAAPGEEEVAYQVLRAFPQERQIDVIAKAKPVVAAAALARCQLYVGNDSGLMHSAAAVGIPTVGLFGPSWPHLYHPWGPKTAWATTLKNFAELTAYPGYDPKTAPCLMTELTVEKAFHTTTDLWKRCYA